MSRWVISACGSRGLPNRLLHAIGKMASHSDCSIGLDLHPLVAAERNEIIEVQLKPARSPIDNLADLPAVSLLPLGREAHDLAFVTVFLVAENSQIML